MNLKLLISLLALGLVAGACGGSTAEGTDESQADEAPAPEYREKRAMILEDIGLASPESVTSDGTHYYVSNVGRKLEPSKKDRDGFISKLDENGEVLEAKFIKGLDAPKGMVVVDGKLYVTDIDKVKGFDLSSGELVTEISFADRETEFLNDLAIGPDGKILVSMTDKNKILSITLADEPIVEEIATDKTVPGPNGLHYDAGQNALYVVSYVGGPVGKVGKIDLDKSPATYTTVSDHEGILDGVVKIGPMLVVSDWNTSSLWLIDPTGNAAKREHPMPARISGSADFYYDAAAGEFWIPGMQENKLYVKDYALR